MRFENRNGLQIIGPGPSWRSRKIKFKLGWSKSEKNFQAHSTDFYLPACFDYVVTPPKSFAKLKCLYLRLYTLLW